MSIYTQSMVFEQSIKKFWRKREDIIFLYVDLLVQEAFIIGFSTYAKISIISNGWLETFAFLAGLSVLHGTLSIH